MAVDAWHIDATLAARVIAQFQRLATPPVLDYEHQTLRAEDNGQAAPAAGWFKELIWREGAGLFGRVELTERARAFIAAREYRYFSPVISYDAKTGDVLAFVMGALTNNPAIDGMQAIALRAAATFGFHPQENSMDPLLLAVLAALGLPQTTTQDAAIAALKATTEAMQGVRTALGVATDANAETLVATCTALKARSATADPSRFVPLETFDQVKTALAALTARVREGDVDALVKSGLDDGRLLPAQETWARDLGKANLAALKSYLDATTPIAALAGSQTRGQPPGDASNAHGLTAAEIAVCTATGVKPDAFAKAKKA